MLSRCVACGGKLKEVKKGQGLHRCPICNHCCFKDEIGTGKYDQAYFQKYEQYEKTPLGSMISKKRWDLLGAFLQPSARVLDWGTGNGSFVHAKPNGYDVYGHDVNPFSPFKRPEGWAEEWDAVTMFDVIEHMERPDTFIRSLNTRLLVLLTPVTDWCRKPSDILHWKHFRPDEHQHYFSRISLLNMLDRCGYEPVMYNHDEGRMRDPQHPHYLITMVARKRGWKK